MNIKSELERMISAHSEYAKAVKRVDSILAKMCAFNAAITYVAGDDHLVMNVDTSDVAPLTCLDGKSAANKLTQEEHFDQSI